ncbi:MAG: CheB methylesterase domain-containing protein [Polyangiales bacterium]
MAKAGLHLRFARAGDGAAVTLDPRPAELLHRPSVSVTFESAAEVFGDAVVAVVLTGMGDDGLSGARAVRARGGAVLTEAASSCAVYGMPRVVKEAGLSSEEAPISAMARAVLRAVTGAAATPSAR